MKPGCLMVVLSPGEAEAVSKSGYPSGSEGMVLLLMAQVPAYQYPLRIVPADHFRIESGSVVLLTVSCDSKDSTDHSSELCEDRPAAHAVENAG